MSQTQTQSLIPNLGIDDKISKSAATSMIQIFSDQLALTLKTYTFGMNVIGPRFYQTHSCLCKQYEKLACLTECSATQIRQLGYRVPTLAEVMKNTHIAPQKADFVDEDSLMKCLLQDHEAFIVFLGREREKIANLPELVIEDFILDQLKAHRIMAWDLRAQLERLEGNMSFAVPTGMTSQHTQSFGQQQQGMMGQQGMGQSPYGTQQGVGMGSQQSYGTMGSQMGTSGQYGQQSTGMERPSQMGSSGMGQTSSMGTSGQFGQPSSTGMGMGQSGMEGYSREQQAWGQPTGMDRPSMGQTSSTGMGQTSGMTGSSTQMGQTSTGPSSSSSSSTGMGQTQQRKF